jgi:D-3-phosphoglycerate dehydrogenase
MSDPQQSEATGNTNGVQNQDTYHIASHSNSPTSSFLHSSYGSSSRTSLPHQLSSTQLKAFNTRDIRVLLLENVNVVAREMLEKQGYQVEFYSSSLPEDQLIEKIR